MFEKIILENFKPFLFENIFLVKIQTNKMITILFSLCE